MLLRKRSFLFVLLLTLLAVGLAGVQAQDDPQPGGSLTFAFSSDWGTLDPAATAVTFARNIMQFIFDPLLRTHPETGEIVPGLAEAYEVSDDGTVIHAYAALWCHLPRWHAADFRSCAVFTGSYHRPRT
jgi:ABC-type transport system substrate-binding protein